MKPCDEIIKEIDFSIIINDYSINKYRKRPEHCVFCKNKLTGKTEKSNNLFICEGCKLRYIGVSRVECFAIISKNKNLFIFDFIKANRNSTLFTVFKFTTYFKDSLYNISYLISLNRENQVKLDVSL